MHEKALRQRPVQTALLSFLAQQESFGERLRGRGSFGKIRLIASKLGKIAHKKAGGFAPPASSPSYEPMYEDRRIGYDNHVEQ
jgi:hypothetical protein